MKHLSPYSRVIVLVACVVSALPVTSFAQSSNDSEIRTAMIYNFARFARWPQDAFQGSSELQICVPRESYLASSLSALNGKPVNNYKISVVYTDDEMSFDQKCHAIILSSDNLNQVQAYPKQGTLVISEEEGIGSGISAIEMVKVGRLNRFITNPSIAKSNNVEISSKLIKLSVRIK